MLNVVYLVFFLATFPFAIARNRLFGFYYAALYIYSAFSIAGYLYLPGLSESLAAYFGDDVGHSALLFTLLSMALFWAVNMIIYRREPSARPLLNVLHSDRVTQAGGVTFGVISVVFVGLLLVNFSTLSWYIFEDAETLPTSVTIFIALYKILVGVLATGYVLVRSPDVQTGKGFLFAYLILLTAFLVASVRLGNRTDPTALLVGGVLFETLARKLDLRTVAAVGFGILVAVMALSVIEYYRYTDGGIQGPLLERVVRNDYYAPAHMLFAAMAFNFIDPLTVLRSNGSNALILLGEPYLQQTVTELFRTNVATRSAGYAFYIFTEGWIFAGWAGIVYNAAVPAFGLWLWNRLACTSSRLANTIALTLVACMLVNVTRGQSSYFIKYLYTFVVPNLALAVVFVRIRLSSATFPAETVPPGEPAA